MQLGSSQGSKHQKLNVCNNSSKELGKKDWKKYLGTSQVIHNVSRDYAKGMQEKLQGKLS